MKMSISQLNSALIYAAVALVQFQVFSLSLSTSRYDLTAFIILFIVVIQLFFVKQNEKFYLYAFYFVGFQLILWLIIDSTPFYRFFSSLVWLGGLIAIASIKYTEKYDRKTVYRLLIASAFILSTIMYYQHFIQGIERPQGFFDEPSYAGLFLFSVCAMLVDRQLCLNEYNQGFGYKNLIFLTFCLNAAFLTKSMHVITFVIGLALIIGSRKVSTRTIFFTCMILIIACIAAYILLTDSHYSSRLKFDDDIDNLSLLAWLQGFDQAKAALLTSPFFGTGLGSTGFIPFDSPHTDTLTFLGLESMAILDAYSALFRLFIEVGGLGVLILFIYLLKRYKAFIFYSKNGGKNDNWDEYSLHLLLFSIVLLIGILIKEPTYARSYVYLGVFLLSTCLAKIRLTSALA